jgi:four helix bundle protein
MNFTDLIAYKKAYSTAMSIFEITKIFPKEEMYSLTDQIRRSSRSVCANIAEAYRKRRYPAHFISKLTDADAENAETQNWLHFALSCHYISKEQHDSLVAAAKETGALINYMINHPDKFA